MCVRINLDYALFSLKNVLVLKVDSELGVLTKNLHKFLSLMQDSGGKTLNPRPVFVEISKKYAVVNLSEWQDEVLAP